MKHKTTKELITEADDQRTSADEIGKAYRQIAGDYAAMIEAELLSVGASEREAGFLAIEVRARVLGLADHYALMASDLDAWVSTLKGVQTAYRAAEERRAGSAGRFIIN